MQKIESKVEKDIDTQWEQIFRTKWIFSNQLFDLAVDSGCYENIISSALVELLNLPIKKHPEPYLIGWIKDMQPIKVGERCLVLLSICKYYNNSIMCDIVDMDVCHALFGRLWQYDRDATYHRRENVYHFIKDGKKIVLVKGTI